MSIPVSNSPKIRVELSIQCFNLKRMDVMSKSDPMVIVLMRGPEGTKPKWVEVGRTEWIKNEDNPSFATPIAIDYYFERTQSLKFAVMDIDNPDKAKNVKWKSSERVACMNCTLGDIVGAVGSTRRVMLQRKKYPNKVFGDIQVKAAEAGEEHLVHMVLSGSHLDKKDLLSKSDPFLVFYRIEADGSRTPVHKTEVIKNTLDPKWAPIEVPLSRLSSGRREQPFFVQCFDWDSDGSNDLIGEFTTSVAEMESKKQFELIEPKLQQTKKSYKNSGIINVHEIRVIKNHSFLDYIFGGTEISLVVGIDYTASNGDPNQPTSLHYRNPNGFNEYQSAIINLGNVVAPYDRDGWIPTFGFGAKIRGTEVSHCFPLSPNPEGCPGVNGVLEAYNQSFQWAQLYGPTNFEPIISHVCSMAEKVSQGEKYYILLMLTDGEITDMQATLKVLNRASKLPMSIIIVGVGGADFGSMRILDDDEGKNYQKMRDVVQLVQYMKTFKIEPRPRPMAPPFQ